MSGADRRAEEQGYYEVDEPARARKPRASEVPLSKVCADAGHKLSATNSMKSCACGERTTGPPQEQGLF